MRPCEDRHQLAVNAAADALFTTTVVNWFPALPQHYLEEQSSSALVSNGIYLNNPTAFLSRLKAKQSPSVSVNGGPPMLTIMERLLQETQASRSRSGIGSELLRS